MKIDVIIPTYRPGRQFQELIRRLKIQTLPPDEIFIWNTEEKFWKTSFDKLHLSNVIHISKDEFDHGTTRAEAAKKSTADIMVFMTQDALPANAYLIENLIRPILSGESEASYARQLAKKNASELEKYTRQFNYPEESRIKSKKDIEELGIKTFFCSNVCAAYKKSVYEELGGFMEHMIFNEDMVFAGKLISSGYRVAYEADALVYHSHDYDLLTQFSRNFDNGVSQKMHPEIFSGIPSEKEGIRLVMDTAKHLIRIGKPWLILDLGLQSASKYLGFFTGKHYDKLPEEWIKKFSWNKNYWKSTQMKR